MTSTAPRRALTPAELLQLAGLLRAQGKIAEAEAAYRRVVLLLPEDAAAATGLGLLLGQKGETAEALAQLRRACVLDPANAETHNNLGRLARAANLPAEALAGFEAALALAPDQPAAHYNRGQALAALGRRDEAIASWRAAVALDPALAPAHFQLGLALQAQGDLPGARAHLQQAAPRHAAASAAYARLLAVLGEAEAANTAYAAALALAPEDAGLFSDAGAALAASGEPERAIALFTRAIALQPNLAAAHNNLGNALAGRKNWAAAAEAYRAALALEPGLPAAHGNLGNATLELMQPAEALRHFDAALAANPGQAESHHGRGKALVLLGELDAASAAHAEAVRLTPGQPEYLGGLAATRQLAADDPDFALLQGYAAGMEDKKSSTRQIWHFAMYRSLEHQGRHEEAFAHLLRGNALRRALLDYDEPKAMRFFDRLIKTYSPALLQNAAPVPEVPDVPIFILGMPRSGSTLVEQILASHRDVFGAGELPYLTDISVGLAGQGRPYPESIAAHGPAALAAAGAAYRARLQALSPGAARITDKMPSNYLHIGLLRLILPGARIILTRRDPVDTCLSCFAQTFGEGQPFTNDLAELGRHYRAYESLVAHWRTQLPEGALLEVQYEALIADFEPQVRRMLAFCNLGWDPACLDFHELKRPVLTASASQVRQKLYTHAAGRARPYGALLAPLLAALQA